MHEVAWYGPLWHTRVKCLTIIGWQLERLSYVVWHLVLHDKSWRISHKHGTPLKNSLLNRCLLVHFDDNIIVCIHQQFLTVFMQYIFAWVVGFWSSCIYGPLVFLYYCSSTWFLPKSFRKLENCLLRLNWTLLKKAINPTFSSSAKKSSNSSIFAK